MSRRRPQAFCCRDDGSVWAEVHLFAPSPSVFGRFAAPQGDAYERTELTFPVRNDDHYAPPPAPAPQRAPFSAPLAPAPVERVRRASAPRESRAAWLSRASGVSRSVVDAYLCFSPIPPRCRRAIEEAIRRAA